MAWPRNGHKPRLPWTAWLSIAVLSSLGACQQDVLPVNGDALGPPKATTTAGAPAMSLVGIDGEGCEMYQAVPAEGEVAAAAILYRTGDGQFTIDKSQAHCAVTMEPDGTDGEGCAIFRAVWPNGESLDQPFYRVGETYSATKGKASCG